jgi:sugar phosphate isomerase/epimerase
MRLCLNDSAIGAPYRDLAEERVKIVHDIGFRTAGISIDVNATDDDIRRVKDIFAKYDMEFGPGAGGTYFHADPAKARTNGEHIRKVLAVAGKLGCPTIRVAGGSLHESNVWMHHPQNHTQRAFEMFIDQTRALLPYAEDARVAICPETTQWTIINGPKRMKEFVDRFDSPYVKVVLDFVNHMTYDRVYNSGEFARSVVGELDDRIGVFHVKDVMVQDVHLVCHIDETPLGTGVLDHEAIIEASRFLEPWKTFSLEHFNQQGVPREEQWRRGYEFIQGVAKRMGHEWTSQHCTRERWMRGECK